jgi:hypothetical protein
MHKKKQDGTMSTASPKLKELYEKLKNREPLTLKAHLLDEGHSGALVSFVLAHDGEEGGDSATDSAMAAAVAV